jgi:uncharacterized BrkB/YihY/UPF0761 family membrane protein
MTETSNQTKNLWQRMSGPLKVGLIFAVLGIMLTIIGIFRDPTTPVTAWSLGIGSLISGVVWGLVSWAIATAAVEVEDDVSRAQTPQEVKKETDEAE